MGIKAESHLQDIRLHTRQMLALLDLCGGWGEWEDIRSAMLLVKRAHDRSTVELHEWIKAVGAEHAAEVEKVIKDAAILPEGE